MCLSFCVYVCVLDTLSVTNCIHFLLPYSRVYVEVESISLSRSLFLVCIIYFIAFSLFICFSFLLFFFSPLAMPLPVHSFQLVWHVSTCQYLCLCLYFSLCTHIHTWSALFFFCLRSSCLTSSAVLYLPLFLFVCVSLSFSLVSSSWEMLSFFPLHLSLFRVCECLADIRLSLSLSISLSLSLFPVVGKRSIDWPTVKSTQASAVYIYPHRHPVVIFFFALLYTRWLDCSLLRLTLNHVSLIFYFLLSRLGTFSHSLSPCHWKMYELQSHSCCTYISWLVFFSSLYHSQSNLLQDATCLYSVCVCVSARYFERWWKKYPIEL